MTSERDRTTARLMRIAMLPAAAMAVAAQGQAPGAVQDYQLPPASPSPAPTAAGPVDADHPVATSSPTTPAPTPEPRPAPELPAPDAALPAAPRTEASARAAEGEAPERPSATVRAAPTLTPSAPSAAAPSPAPSEASPSLAPESLPSAAPAPAAETSPSSAGAAFPWPWVAGGAAIVLALAGFLFRRRRSEQGESAEDEAAPAAPEPESPPVPAPTVRDRSPPSPAPAPLPEPKFGAASEPPPLEMQLESRHLSRALVNATLAYRLTLTNRTTAPLGPLHIAGDIISAHASLAEQDQLAPAGEALAPLHQGALLAPGASFSFSGELRIPLASILPIHSGGGRVFVPLARFRAEAPDGTAATCVFVIGQASAEPGGALRPFPLDRGPGVDRALGQHELKLSA